MDGQMDERIRKLIRKSLTRLAQIKHPPPTMVANIY